MPELHEPLAPGTGSTLRRAVLQLRSSERRRVFGPVLHVGSPGGAQTSYAAGVSESLDQAVRADVVAAMLRVVARSDGGTPPVGETPLVWETRTGDLALNDVDAAWLAAAGQAFGEAGRSLTLVVVTPRGWWDPRSDVRRVWKRLRSR